MKVIRMTVWVLLVASLLGFAGGYTILAANKGAPEMTLNGGKSGPVPFPHLVHQTKFEDCNTCHELFPQEPGAIDALKASGELKKKQVMNKQCTKCHKQMKKEGQKTGPTTCKTCHAKNG